MKKPLILLMIGLLTIYTPRPSRAQEDATDEMSEEMGPDAPETDDSTDIDEVAADDESNEDGEAETDTNDGDADGIADDQDDDADGDGIPNDKDTDDDGDGLEDAYEAEDVDSDNDGIIDIADMDDDDDGIPDDKDDDDDNDGVLDAKARKRVATIVKTWANEDAAARGPRIKSLIKTEKIKLAKSKKTAKNKLIAKELLSLEDLGDIRAALSVYYGDKKGKYPKTLTALKPKYLKYFPKLHLHGTKHKPTNAVRVISHVNDAEDMRATLKDSGKWLYVADPNSHAYGEFIIDCTHTNAMGNRWYLY